MCSEPCWCTRARTWQSGRFRNKEQPQGPQCLTGSCCPYLLTPTYVYTHRSRPRLLASCNTPPAGNMDGSTVFIFQASALELGETFSLSAPQNPKPCSLDPLVQPRTTTVKPTLQGHPPLIFQMGVLHAGCFEAYMQGLWPSGPIHSLRALTPFQCDSSFPALALSEELKAKRKESHFPVGGPRLARATLSKLQQVRDRGCKDDKVLCGYVILGLILIERCEPLSVKCWSSCRVAHLLTRWFTSPQGPKWL